MKFQKKYLKENTYLYFPSLSVIESRCFEKYKNAKRKGPIKGPKGDVLHVHYN